MPVINPLWLAAMRRQWPLVGAVTLFLVFLVVHATLFRPAANRYQDAVRRAQSLGLSLEPSDATLIPPRVNAILAANALPAAVARENGESGALSAGLIETVSRIAARQRIDILVTEPGPTSQQPQAAVVRAHLRGTGTYAAFLGFLEDLAGNEQLFAIDRFSLQPGPGSSILIDLHVSRYVLKQAPATP